MHFVTLKSSKEGFCGNRDLTTLTSWKIRISTALPQEFQGIGTVLDHQKHSQEVCTNLLPSSLLKKLVQENF